MKNLLCVLVASLAPGLLSVPVSAERIAIEQPTLASDLPRPARGSTMAAVESKFGAPEVRHPAVGVPPITRWEYPRIVVVFEHDRVIHAVVKR